MTERHAECELALERWRRTCQIAHATDPDPVDFRAGYSAAITGDGSLDQALTMANDLGGEVAALREAIASAMTSLATGPLKDGYAYSVLQEAMAVSSPAAEPPDEDEVERAAKAIRREVTNGRNRKRGSLYRDQALAALTAARESTP